MGNKYSQKFNKTEKKNNLSLIAVASLLIYSAKIDENFTDKEKLRQLMSEAEENEKNSNQILDFTKNIKNTDNDFKIKIIESLWKIIYSDENSDIYEANLMRRLSGLLYLDKKIVGDIKEKIKRDFNKWHIL